MTFTLILLFTKEATRKGISGKVALGWKLGSKFRRVKNFVCANSLVSLADTSVIIMKNRQVLNLAIYVNTTDGDATTS